VRKRNRILAAAAAMAIGSVTASWVSADIVTPAGVSPGQNFYMVFVSASTSTAESSTPSDYDSIVAGDASTAGVDTYNGSPVTWEALASFFNGPDAISRFDPSAPIYLVDGTEVAANGAGLWSGTLQNPIDIEPDGTVATTDAEVWTGTNADGTAASNANGSKSLGSPGTPTEGAGAQFGDATDSNAMWTNDNVFLPEVANQLYGFSSELTAVPEPASAGVLIAGAALALSRRSPRRK
jgi:hypothetical protein